MNQTQTKLEKIMNSRASERNKEREREGENQNYLEANLTLLVPNGTVS